jgi:hypothetical protein
MMKMNRLRGFGALLVVSAMALWAAPAAFAQSTDLYPAGDSVSSSSTPITLTGPYTLPVTCTFNPGAFSLPAKGNPSGPVTTNFTTRPTFTACSNLGVVETSGTWTVSGQYGDAAATITIPISGFKMTLPGAFAENTSTSWTMTGVWNNGFSSPVGVASSIDFLQSKDSYFASGTGKAAEFTFGSAFSTLTDITHPGSPLLLGP